MSEPCEQNRQEALAGAIKQIEKAYGKGSIMYLKEGQGALTDGISSGALSLDLALGGAGMPRGRVIEVFGPESSGKTTLSLHVIASAQRAGGAAAFIDAEHGFDPSWAKRLGVDLEGLMVNQPCCGEEALEICEMLVRSGALDVIVIDSVAALVPRHELEGQMGDAQVGAQARLMSQAMRKLTGICSKSRTSVVFINQIREKIGVMYGSPETTPGGRALKFYSSVRVDVRRIGLLKDGDTVIGTRVRGKVVKNKVAPPFRQAEFDILFECGISTESDLLDIGVECDIVNRSGTWYSYGQERLGQGRENARQFLCDHQEICAEIREKVLAAKLPKPAEEKPAEEKAAEPAAKTAPKTALESQVKKAPSVAGGNRRPVRSPAQAATSRKR